MHLPGPLRAAVGLVATAAAEARHLPDRAIELPMLAVSSAMQASLRAQQRYARLAARGDDVLNRRTPTEQPPPWARCAHPARGGEGRGRAGPPPDGGAPSMFDELFCVEDPTLSPDGREPVDEIPPPDEPPVAPIVPASTTPSHKDPARKTAARKSAARKSPARKSAPPKTAATKTATNKTAAKKTAANKTATNKTAAATSTPATSEAATSEASTSEAATPSVRAPKEPLSKPRHTAPSAFDNVADE